MPLSVALTHRTTYRYDRLVTLGPQTIRLRPAPHARTPVLSYALIVEPKPHFINWQQDPQGNHLARVVFPERVTHLDVTVDLVADMATIDPFDFFLEPEAEQWPFSYDPLLEQELAPFRRLAPIGPRLQTLLDAAPRGEQRTVDMLVALNRAVQSRVAYIVRMEPGVWTSAETLAAGQDTCRDSAWLLVHALRQLGYTARFVSGYLIQLVGDVKPLTGPMRAGMAIGPDATLSRARTPADRHVAMPRSTASRRVTSSSAAACRQPITGLALCRGRNCGREIMTCERWRNPVPWSGSTVTRTNGRSRIVLVSGSTISVGRLAK
jgi:transglutaminase-like putative cysteine protease